MRKRALNVAPMPRKTLMLAQTRRVRGGSPWIFSNEIRMDESARAIPPGSIVNVRTQDGRAVGTGYFNPRTLIGVRLLCEDLDADIGLEFFLGRIERALALRNEIYQKPFYRLLHAEGDGVPGLVVDRFADSLTIQIGTWGMENLKDLILEALDRRLKPKRIILRADSSSRALEGLDCYVALVKGKDEPLTLEENGIFYRTDLLKGQKTGWYYDQRDNRAFIAMLAKDKTVLDGYSYTGGFGIASAKAGARAVVCIDSSAPALAMAQESAQLNAVTVETVKADLFEELARLKATGRMFDIVVADPPPFVKSKKDLEPGAKAYRKLARLAAEVAAPGGILLLASCSHNIAAERFALECAQGLWRSGRGAKLIRQSGASPDHPVHPMLAETAYLKACVYVLD